MVPLPSVSPHRAEAPVDVVVLTTAALPWRTGPSLFSLWHAAGLSALGYRVAYGLPWLAAGSQKRLWGEVRFPDRDAQEAWLRLEAERLGAPPLPDIFFFDGVFSRSMFSIFMTGDAYAAAPPARAVLIHEPEHFRWLPFTRSRRKVSATKIVGIVMTNYGHYIRRPGRPDLALFARMVEWNHKRLMRRHTDIIVPLSPALDLRGLEDMLDWRQVTGVLQAFAEVPPVPQDSRDIYFLGRLTWDKGLRQVIDVAARTKLPIDVHGDGPDEIAIKQAATLAGAPVRFCGPTDSPWDTIKPYSVFFNPSLSEVLCSTTAEALVAGRHVVLPRCPANQPFMDLPNVHIYDTDAEIEPALHRARSLLPERPDLARARFDWPTVCRSVADLLTS